MTNQELQAFWQQQVERQQSSGLSAKQFSEQHGLIYHQLIYWRKKCTDATTEQLSAGFTKVTPVSAPASQATDPGLCIHMPGGLCITGIEHSNLDVLLSMLRQL